MNNVKMLINEVKENLKNYDKENAINKLFELCDIVENYELMENIIHTDDISEFVNSRLAVGGWQGVACCLAKIEYLNDEYYLIDGYGNLEELSVAYIDCLLSDLINSIDISDYEQEE